MSPEESQLLARLDERVQTLTKRLDETCTMLDRLEERLQAFERQAAKWRGGLALMVGLGGAVAAIVQIADKAFAWMGKR